MLLRKYQQEVLELAKRENTVMAGKTGIGKTHVAISLLRHLDYTSKVAFFLAPTQQLVTQIYDKVKKMTMLTAQMYLGQDIDLWNKEKWLKEFKTFQVLLVTPEILRNIIQKGYLTMSNINIIIFDECHHVRKRHPANQLMKFYDPNRMDEMPRIFGMTASPTADCAENLHSKLKDFSSEDISTYAATVPIVVEYFKENSAFDYNDIYREYNFSILDYLYGNNSKKLNIYSLYSKALDEQVKNTSTAEETFIMKKDKVEKKRRKFLRVVQQVHEHLGLWCALQVIELYFLPFTKQQITTQKTSEDIIEDTLSDIIDELILQIEQKNPEMNSQLKDIKVFKSLESIKEKEMSQFVDIEESEYNQEDNEYLMVNTLQVEHLIVSKETSQLDDNVENESMCIIENSKFDKESNKMEVVEVEFTASNIEEIDNLDSFLPPLPEENNEKEELNTFKTLHTLLSQDKKNSLNSPTDKVHILINKLQNRPKSSSQSLLIFVCQRITARVLMEYLREYFTDQLLVGCMLGQASSNDEASIGIGSFKETLRKLFDRKLQVLVTTSVSSEGVDFPQCDLVIVFDPLVSPRYLIHTRGRARHKDGVVVYMLPNGDNFALKHYLTLAQYADEITNLNFCHDAIVTNGQLPRSIQLPTYRYTIEKTGAIIDLDSSLVYLYQFFQSVPGYKSYSLEPIFTFKIEIDENCGVKYIAELRLPSCIGLEACIFLSDEMDSKQMAKCVAAFKACVDFHKQGYLDDDLNSVFRVQQSTKFNYTALNLPALSKESLYIIPAATNILLGQNQLLKINVSNKIINLKKKIEEEVLSLDVKKNKHRKEKEEREEEKVEREEKVEMNEVGKVEEVERKEKEVRKVEEGKVEREEEDKCMQQTEEMTILPLLEQKETVSNGDNLPTIADDDLFLPPIDYDNSLPPITDDNILPAITDDNTLLPMTDDNTLLPMTDDNTSLPISTNTIFSQVKEEYDAINSKEQSSSQEQKSSLPLLEKQKSVIQVIELVSSSSEEDDDDEEIQQNCWFPDDFDCLPPGEEDENLQERIINQEQKKEQEKGKIEKGNRKECRVELKRKAEVRIDDQHNNDQEILNLEEKLVPMDDIDADENKISSMKRRCASIEKWKKDQEEKRNAASLPSIHEKKENATSLSSDQEMKRNATSLLPNVSDINMRLPIAPKIEKEVVTDQTEFYLHQIEGFILAFVSTRPLCPLITKVKSVNIWKRCSSSSHAISSPTICTFTKEELTLLLEWHTKLLSFCCQGLDPSIDFSMYAKKQTRKMRKKAKKEAETEANNDQKTHEESNLLGDKGYFLVPLINLSQEKEDDPISGTCAKDSFDDISLDKKDNTNSRIKFYTEKDIQVDWKLVHQFLNQELLYPVYDSNSASINSFSDDFILVSNSRLKCFYRVRGVTSITVNSMLEEMKDNNYYKRVCKERFKPILGRWYSRALLEESNKSQNLIHVSQYESSLSIMRASLLHSTFKHVKERTNHLERYVVPEHCSFVGINRKLYENGLSILPLLYALEREMALRTVFDLLNKNSNNGLQITYDLLGEALTKPNYERYEAIGDTFLKLETSWCLYEDKKNIQLEGILTMMRRDIVQNERLQSFALERNLHLYFANPMYIQQHPFLYWSPSLLPKAKALKVTCKVIADLFEALCGVYLVYGGEEAGRNFLRWGGVPVLSKLSYKMQFFPHYVDEINFNKVIEVKRGKREQSIDATIKILSHNLGYTFHNQDLLIEAITHPSYTHQRVDTSMEVTRDYQRLEYLGDAVIEYIVMSYGFRMNPLWQPGSLTEWKVGTVANSALSKVAILKFSVHNLMLHGESKLKDALKETTDRMELNDSIFSTSITQEQETEDNWNLPKIYADVFEALVAAVFIDSGYDLAIVANVFLPPMIEIVGTNAKELADLIQEKDKAQVAPRRSVTDHVYFVVSKLVRDVAIAYLKKNS